MLFRFEYNIQTGLRTEIPQTVYRKGESETIILDSGIAPPDGFSEFTGDLTQEEETPEQT